VYLIFLKAEYRVRFDDIRWFLQLQSVSQSVSQSARNQISRKTAYSIPMSLPSTPISITPSAAEIKNGALSQRHLEIAIRALVRDGLVVLEDMIEHAVLDRLNEKMVQDAYELQGRKESP
jgi:hypothetical protein